jgi:hypothetical protein
LPHFARFFLVSSGMSRFPKRSLLQFPVFPYFELPLTALGLNLLPAKPYSVRAVILYLYSMWVFIPPTVLFMSRPSVLVLQIPFVSVTTGMHIPMSTCIFCSSLCLHVPPPPPPTSLVGRVVGVSYNISCYVIPLIHVLYYSYCSHLFL